MYAFVEVEVGVGLFVFCLLLRVVEHLFDSLFFDVLNLHAVHHRTFLLLEQWK